MSFSVRGARSGRTYPAVNLYELDDQFLITAEIPGVNPESLDLSIASGVLTIRGQLDADSSIPDEQYRRRERLHGPWERSLALPERVDEEGLSAELKEGVLRIQLPKAVGCAASFAMQWTNIFIGNNNIVDKQMLIVR